MSLRAASSYLLRGTTASEAGGARFDAALGVEYADRGDLTEESIEIYEDSLDRIHDDMVRVRTSFDSDIERFRELKGEAS